MKVWIDTASGTWGEVDDSVGRLMIVDLEEVARTDGEETDVYSYFTALDSMDDSEIANFADRYGVQPVAGLSLEDLGQVVRMVLPSAEFEQDNDGQWIIYTGRY